MGRIVAIDYGTKKTGIAATDPLQIIPSGLGTYPTPEVIHFLKNYIEKEEVETIVVGDPKHKDGSPGSIAHLVKGFVRKLKKLFPTILIETFDERFTSVRAEATIRQVVSKKKKRRDKTLVDKVSAVILLQDYMETL